MIAATIISNLNVREHSAKAVLVLSESNQTLDDYIQNSNLFFTDFNVEQEFISRLLFISQRMDESLALLDSSLSDSTDRKCQPEQLTLVQN